MAASTEVLPARPAWYEGRFARWLTTTDHKEIGVLYLWTALVFLVLGVIASLIMRAHVGGVDASLSSRGYREVFTLHLAAATFLVLVPLVTGLATFLVPLLIGARTIASPRVAAFAYWLYALGGLTLVLSFLNAGTGRCGWSCYAPLSNVRGGGHTGDLWVLSLLMLALATAIALVAVVVTLHRLRAEGMTWERVPPFARAIEVYALVLIVLAAAAVVVCALLLLARHDRVHLGAGSLRHLFWLLGYPEMFLLVLPAVGIVTEVWHVVRRDNAGGLRPATAALCSLCAAATIAIGVVSGILPVLRGGQPFDGDLALAVVDYAILGAVFLALFAGLHYWWPKLFGRLLDERLAVSSVWFVFIGLNLAYFPAYLSSDDRLYTYPHFASWNAIATVSMLGAAVFAFGMLLFAVNAFRTHALRAGRRAGNDPWVANTLEWFTASPPPAYNFATVPPVSSARPLRDLRVRLKERGDL